MLTDGQIERLNLRKGQKRVFRDGTIPGLALRACGPYRRTWYFFYRPQPHAKQIRKRLGAFPSLNVNDARIAALGVIKRPQHASTLTFGELSDRFIREYAEPRLRGAQEIRRMLDRHVLPLWGKRIAADITKTDARELLAAVERPGAQRRVRSWTTRIFNWSMEQDMVDRNPLEKLKDPTPAVARERVLTDDELMAVWHAAEGYPFGPLTRLLILTGARRGELIAADRSWVQDNFIEMPSSYYKTKRTHLIVLSPMAKSIVAALPNEGLLFTTTGEEPVSGISRWKTRLDKLSGVENWRLHDLRRTCATGMARLGVQPIVIEAVLGHKLPGVAGVYNRYSYVDERKKALSRWSQHVKRLAEGR